VFVYQRWHYDTSHLRLFSAGFFKLQAGGNTGNGTSENDFSYLDLEGNTYHRRVNAAYNAITLDEESGTLAGKGLGVGITSAPSGPPQTFPGARLPGSGVVATIGVVGRDNCVLAC
jgi:hypothetical protein